MSFEIALSGLSAINTDLNTISNNIANSGTYGFKSSRSNFASVYAGTQPSGVEVASTTQTIGKNGNAQATGRGLDAMIQGKGFFVAKNDATGETLYTRVGIFSADKDGYILDSFGNKVQGYATRYDANGKPVSGGALGAVGDLKLRSGAIPAQATDSLSYVGNLSSDWTVPTVAFDPSDPLSYNSSIVTPVYDSLGVKHTATQYFIKTGVNTVEVRYGFDGSLRNTPPPGGDVTVDGSAWTVTTTDPGPAVPPNPAVNIATNPLVPGQPQTYTWTFAGFPATPAQSAVLHFDTEGQLASVEAVQIDAAGVRTTLGTAPSKPKPYPTPADWTSQSVPKITVAMGTPPGANPVAVAIDYAATTQFGGSSTTLANSANGYSSGVLSGVQIDEDGSVMGVYSNGLRQRAGTLALATFPSEDGLQAVSDTAWIATSKSGTALYSTPGAGLAGTLKAGALEQSNVDLSTQLVMLMTAQRNYQANTKVISTNSAMMQSLMQAV